LLSYVLFSEEVSLSIIKTIQDDKQLPRCPF